MAESPTPASQQDGTYPRPQLVRPRWVDLCGEWDFDVDDCTSAPLHPRQRFARTIVVPYPPEAPLSGIGDTGYHPVVWYRRRVTADDLAAAGLGGGGRLLLHLGAVDYRADVWAGGQHVGHHEGGHTPFTVDVTDAVSADGFELVVRAEDDPRDLEQPRGKQDWEPGPHVIWYHRTTGIWQPVWLEAVPAQHVLTLQWRPDVPGAHVGLRLELADEPAAGTSVRVTVTHGTRRLAQVTTSLDRRREEVNIPLAVLRHGQDLERFLWSPEHPTLLDAEVELFGATGLLETVTSYLGLRTISTGGGRFLLNARPYPVRAVLSQGYWPQSHLAAPSAEALREEVQLIKDLGFTTARVHQKIEDPRLLFWADRLGLLLWEEMPSAYEFSELTASRLVREWTEVVARDASHPCIAAWVPLNESWGVPCVADDARQQHLARSLYHLTRSLDGTRPVISNDGWEHTDSDLLTIHDYENDPAVLAAAYADHDAITRTTAGIGPGDRRIFTLPPEQAPGLAGAPVIVSEFGGVSLESDAASAAWGYRTVATTADLEEQLRGIFGALHASDALAGWCYTQLTDTVQETNGLTDEKRQPKLPTAAIRRIVRGEP